MDWTGYPLAIAGDAEVATTADLGLVLGRTGPFWDALATSLAAADGDDVDQLAYAFPREHRAFTVWQGYTTPPLADALVAALAALPDAPVDPDVELLPVELTRLIASRLPNTNTNLSLQYRETPGAPNITRAFITPTATVEIDPRLLVQFPPPAVFAVRLTVADAE